MVSCFICWSYHQPQALWPLQAPITDCVLLTQQACYKPPDMFPTVSTQGERLLIYLASYTQNFSWGELKGTVFSQALLQLMCLLDEILVNGRAVGMLGTALRQVLLPYISLNYFILLVFQNAQQEQLFWIIRSLLLKRLLLYFGALTILLATCASTRQTSPASTRHPFQSFAIFS